MIKEINNAYVDANNNEYRFKISKSIDKEYFELIIFCFLNRVSGPIYECDQDSVTDLPSEYVSDEFKHYINKYIKNIAFT